MGFLAETAELAVRISLKDNASAGIRGLQKNLGSLSGSIGRVGKGAGQIGAGFARAGLVVGGAVVTGLTAATKATIDFQDAFAGVRKTVEGTPAELDEMYGSLRQLATRIPVKFTDLAGIAQEAGALGVARDDVVGFTDVVARLSAATVGLSTDAAAEAFGKLGNVLFTTQEKADGLIDEYNRMGSALVALGNAGASSEGDIIEVAKRFGAAGHAAGLSAAEILGVSSALASLGIEPEAAGGALSRLFNNLTTNLALGNKKAVAFGKTIGLTAAGAKKAFGKDALGTFETFLQKLAGLDKFKQAEVLKAAGITNTRDINAIRLMSQQYAELQRQVDLSTKAYDENTELAKISAARFDTLKNKLITLKNLFFDAAVTVGEGFTPALGRAADKLRTFLSDPANQQSLQDLGKDIGETIDSIDWNKVRDGAKTLVSAMKGALDIALAIAAAIDKLPDGIKNAGIAFLALNKLSGGLVGQGVGNVVGGLAGAAATGLGSRLPGVGKLFAQPVFVTNWPAGGLGGVGGGAAGATGGMGLASKVFLVGEAIGLALLVKDVADQVGAGAKAQTDGIHDVLDASLKTPQSLKELQIKLDGINQGLDRLPKDPIGRAIFQDSINELQQMRTEVIAAIDAQRPMPPDERGLLSQIAKNTSGSPDDRDERHFLQNPARIADKVKHLAGLGAIGSKDDPYGFKHLKSLSLYGAGKNDPVGLKGELKWHIGEVDKAIKKAVEKGDPKTVEKLQETKAGLEHLLGQVKDGTYKAGEKTYAGTLAAADRIVGAIHGLPAPIVKLSVTSTTFIRAAQQSGTYTAAHVGAYNKAGSLI